MQKSTTIKFSIFIAFVLVFGIFSIKENNYGQAQMSQKQPTSTTNSAMGKETVTRDAVTLLLEGKTLAKGDYIELYDSTPYKIVNGHFVAKVPCTPKGQSEVDLLTGIAPNFKSSDAEFIKQLSTPGKICLYHVDLLSDSKNTITDIAIKNNSTHTITFPSSSSVGVGVNKIAELPAGQG